MGEKQDKLLDFKVEIYDVLNNIFNGMPPISEKISIQFRPSEVLIDGTGRDNNHNFDRDKFKWRGAYRITYNGENLALLEQKPHKRALIHDRVKKLSNRYARSMLINTLKSDFPGVEVLLNG